VALTDCLNFGNPEKPEVAYQLEQAIIGLSEAGRALGTPVISGNASLYNETPDGQIHPTPTIGMLGILDDVKRHLTIVPPEGSYAVLLGAEVAQGADALAGSEYLVTAHAKFAGRPSIDLDLEARVQRLVLDAHAEGLLAAAHDISDGGLAVALSEMCIAGGTGVDAGEVDVGSRSDAALFGETQSRFLVAVPDDATLARLQDVAAAADVPSAPLGRFEGDRIRLGPIDVALPDVRARHDGGLAERLAGEVEL
jgi:phosphoribosylformylglycinamidine (FGAM) synthase-like enzyme